MRYKDIEGTLLLPFTEVVSKMAFINTKSSDLTDWQEISRTHLEEKQHWFAFFRVVICTPVFWLHAPLFEYMTKGKVQPNLLLVFGLTALVFSGSSSIAMFFTGRHRLNLLAWIAVPGFVSLPVVLLLSPGLTSPLQGILKTMGLIMAASMGSGALAWLLGIRFLPWLAKPLSRG